MKEHVKLKICGITDRANMLALAAMEPDYLGFIFYRPSPRDVSEKIVTLPLKDLPSSIKKVAVMVNQPLEEALSILNRYPFDLVQLHGSETAEYCKQIQKIVPVIKAFSVKDALPANLDDYKSCCDYYLFDTKADKPGGSGLRFNHAILNEYKGEKPFFLSGGIDPDYFLQENVFSHARLHALDINSRFESTPGVKDIKKVYAFLNEIADNR